MRKQLRVVYGMCCNDCRQGWTNVQTISIHICQHLLGAIDSLWVVQSVYSFLYPVVMMMVMMEKTKIFGIVDTQKK